MDQAIPATPRREPWNKGKLVGQKAPLKVEDIWAIRVRLQLYDRTRELALFNLGVDSKLGACDLVALRVRDVSMEAGSRRERSSCSRRPNDLCNSRSRR
jgi:hypothetical protein